MGARAGDQKMGWNATFAMAVGGMIGGGIFSVLGVVVDIAGSWAWASFVLGGCVAFLTARSYVRLVAVFGEGGGAFTFLSRMGHRSFAGSLSWLLIAGYVLTNAVYAFTFGALHGCAGRCGWPCGAPARRGDPRSARGGQPQRRR